MLMARAFFIPLLLISLLYIQLGFAQVSIEEMQRSLNDGNFAIAAQVTGPALIIAFPESADAYYLYSQALYLSGNIEAAQEQFDRALALSTAPLDPEYEHLNGLLRAAKGEITDALRALRVAFSRSRNYAMAMDWARVAWESGNFEEALEAYAAAAETEQGLREGWPYLNRGRIYKGLGHYQEAIAAFNQAIEVFASNDIVSTQPSPGYVEAFYRLGEVYELLGDIPQAKANYQAAASDGTYAPALEALTRLGGQ
jgi:tetratricopeptide (TPR) repeat protein